MKVQEIRTRFFEFFKQKNHEIVPSAPMVLKNDPTLMFTNAGMNQFKDFFLGNNTPNQKRVANSQKCLRVSGKHNDLEEVGVDTYHHTMFEMLGNWSFGDYFKEEAIAWAWELLTENYKIPKDQLYVTVFEGDTTDNVPMDQESYEIWKKYIDEDRIILASKKDNFWEMGETGPCGPCSEIHVDIRPLEDRSKISGKSLVNQDHPQVIEIWNNVFMEFNRKANGSLESLPAKHVDTGMGLERLAMTLQGKTSNYDTDLFQTLIQKIERLSGKKYGKDEQIDIALRVISDHIRAIAFSIADGQLPSNNGAGYVIRRILRRAIRYGYQTLGLKEPFMCELSSTLGQEMGEAYPELIQQKDIIFKVIQEEETSFFRTLELGIKRIENIIEDTKKQNKQIIDGVLVFELYDTFGFPVDLTSLIARENNLEIDQEAFEAELQKQKERSRAASSFETDDWMTVHVDESSTFVGYDEFQTETKILRYRKVIQNKKEFYQLVLDKTPFYAEGGGQVGDNGWLTNENETITVFNTKKENNLTVHLTNKLPSQLDASFTAKINISDRNNTTKNHSATHLLHEALRTVLGDHVEQKGSLVAPNYLRFDFSHFSKVTPEEIERIEALVNTEIQKSLPLQESRNIPIEQAKEMGAKALFGEKYDNLVRIIQFGKSIELCGGCHVQNTQDITIFKITSESAVAAGIRRIEAITGQDALNYYKEKETLLNDINDLLKRPKNVVKSIEDLLVANQKLSKQIEKFQLEKANSIKSQLKQKISPIASFNVLAETVELDGGAIKDILFQLRGENENFIGIIGGKNDNKCTLSMIISDSIVSDKQLDAGKIIREVSKHIQGGGGGQAFFATAGGKNSDGLTKAISEIKEKISE
ncbi:MAG: alanine--tRNA ligase [Crocinitomicaceae bacterium]